MTGLKFDVVGAEGPKRFFSRLTKDTIGHGYLFTGTAGVGKKTFARALAQSILCEAPHTGGLLGYDGTCASCKLIGREETRHPDLLESIGALKIGDTDEALGFHEGESTTSRDLVRQLSLQSYLGGFRIFVLGDIDFASPAAANALLKFFEEPPASVLLLLTTSTPARLLSTIRSRLIEIRFPTLRHVEVAQILRAKGFDAEQAELGASLSQGSVTRALATLAQDEEQLRAQVAAWFFNVVDGRTPGRPVANVARRSSIMARTTSRSTSAPLLAACDRTSERCNCARSSGAICRVASAPNPVETPYTGSPDSASASMCAREAATRASASPLISTRALPRATATTWAASSGCCPPTATGGIVSSRVCVIGTVDRDPRPSCNRLGAPRTSVCCMGAKRSTSSKSNRGVRSCWSRTWGSGCPRISRPWGARC